MKALAKRVCCNVAVLALIPGIAFQASALDPGKTLTQYAHRIWGQEEGLFQATIYSILQARDGFLWLGTQDSLIRFDGARFRDFDAGGTLQHSLIRTLLEDREGNLWAGSIGSGVVKLTAGGAITRYTTKDGLPSDNVFCLASDSQNRIWICTNEGLALLDHRYVRVFTTADGLPSNQIRSTCEASDGTRWVAGLDFGLSRSKRARFERYSDSQISIRENVTALHCAHDGSVWVGKSSGLTQIGAGFSRSFSVHDGLPDNAVSSLTGGPDGSIWIGTKDGITRYQNGEISVYRTRDGLSHSSVLSLYVDREGSLWAGTKDGLDQFADGKVTPYTTNEGMLSNDAGPVLEDATGHLWIGTLGRGLNSFDGHRFRSLTTKDGLADNTILSLETGKENEIWVGTKNGLNRLSIGKVVAKYTATGGLSGPEIQALFMDTSGTLWAGTNKGLDRFDGTHFTKAGIASPRNPGGVLALRGAHTVQLFVSTEGGAFYYLRDNAFNSYPLKGVIRPVDSYYNDPVHHSEWMGTLGSGLLRWQNGRLAHIRVKDGLYDNRIYSILKDDRSNFWMASSKGIFRVSEKELEDFGDGKTRTITSIPFSTGQLRFECQSGVQPAACRTRDGRLWFSTTNGLVVVDPNHLRQNEIAPPVHITAIVVNGQSIEPNQNLQLKPFEKNVEIRYAGLSFISPEKVTFRYILSGYEKTWTDAGARREAFFTNLPPGNFQFKVMARNADGIWSSQAAGLSFAIQPRLYQRPWFFPLLGLTLAIAIAAGYRMRIQQLKQRFDLVLAERSRIARELHDTLLQGLSGITMQLQALWIQFPASREKRVLGEIIRDAGRCSTEARQSLWGLRAVRGEALNFSEKLHKLARQAVAERTISLVIQLEPVSLDALPEVEYQLLRIAQEAISNAVRHAQARAIKIRLNVQEEELELTFADDGTGFAADLDQAALGHFGVLGMRERANEIGAELSVTSSPGQGTEVSIHLPFPSSQVSEGNQRRAFEHQVG
jgi:signal transduction histidine kinase/ligand-binding sensor domain-containing protein